MSETKSLPIAKKLSNLNSFGMAKGARNPVGKIVTKMAPFYTTSSGAAYVGDAGKLLQNVKSDSIQLIMTSPPYALIRKKPYGNVEQERYVEWFMEFSDELRRVLTPDGSLVIDIGGSWQNGSPTKSTYQFELLLALTKEKFYLAQDFYWWNPARLPSPAEWVNVRRVRVKDSVDTVWWLSKSKEPKANNRRVLQPYSEAQKKLFKNGVKSTTRPSGHEITQNFCKKHKGAIPSNLIKIANTDSNSRYLQECRNAGIESHPARFPIQLPDFFIRFLTDPGDVVLDPFAGSNATGWAAEARKRSWISFEIERSYLEASRFRWGYSEKGEAFF